MNRLVAALPIVIGAALTLAGRADPLVLPVLMGFALGMVARRPAPFDLCLLAAATGAVLAPSPILAAVAWCALLALGVAARRSVLAGISVTIGGGAVLAAASLMPDGPIDVLLQLRLLALAGGGVVVGVGALGLSGPPAARRAAAVALIVAVLGLALAVPTLVPDGWRLTARYLVWGAPAAALFAAIWILKGGAPVVVAIACPIAPALLGALTTTGVGIDAAAWVLAAPALAIALADDDGNLPGPWSTLAVIGLPGALPAVAGGAALIAAMTAIHPAPLRWAALAVMPSAIVALIVVIARMRRIEKTPLDLPTTGALLAVGLALALIGWPTAERAEEVAEAAAGHALPIDDMRGWRRLSRLQPTPSPTTPPDAGVP